MYYRDGILAWQWRYYATWHQDRLNLMLHMLAVPLFVAGTLAMLRQAFFGEWFGAAMAAVMVLLAHAIELAGHLREPARGPRAENPYDFIRLLLAEQFITFPRFVLSGGWLHQMVSRPQEH